MDWSWSAHCAVGEFRCRQFSSQAIPLNMCGTEPQQLRFWSLRNRRWEAICWIASMRWLRNMHSYCRRAVCIAEEVTNLSANGRDRTQVRDAIGLSGGETDG